jgi:hypothetical protein
MTIHRRLLALLAVLPAVGFLAPSAFAQSAPPAAAPAPAVPPPDAAPSPPPAGAPVETPLAASPEAPPSAEPAPATTASPGGLAPPQPLAPGASQRLAGSAYDGPPLLLGPGKLKLGAYGSLGVAYTHMLHRDGVATDFAAAVLIDHRISMGLAGYVFSRTPKGPANYDGTPREFSTVYGGLLLRYAVFADFPVYGSLGVLVGGGALVLRDRWDYYRRDRDVDVDDDDDYVTRRETAEGYFVAQPDITLHVNATRWLRFGVTGGYRFATAVQRFGYDSTAMSGAVVGGNIELGWF